MTKNNKMTKIELKLKSFKYLYYNELSLVSFDTANLK